MSAISIPWRLSVVMAMLAAVLAAYAIPAAGVAPVEKQRVIVTFDAAASAPVVTERIEARGAKHVKHLAGAHAGVFEVTPAQHSAIAEQPGVRSVEADVRYSALAKPVRNTQVLPWGIDRIDAEQVWSGDSAAGVTVAVIDTGIDRSHPDLSGNIIGGYSAVAYTTNYKDDHGHGTHVAGTVAASDNLFGVVGVGPKASLLGVKVLDSSGSGWVSDIIEGVDWAVANGADVINMSLGGSSYLSAFQSAIDRANAAGVVVVAAAGNSGPGNDTVDYPGAYQGVIAVSAVDYYNGVASFSSRGPQVDIAAPGVSVRSTYWTPRRGSGYADMSGTSMASPHVAGAAALVLASPVSVAWDSDADGTWDPSEVEAKLKWAARDLGAVGADPSYGAGLLDAYAATRP